MEEEKISRLRFFEFFECDIINKEILKNVNDPIAFLALEFDFQEGFNIQTYLIRYFLTIFNI